MGLRVIGAGLGRTGTLSLKLALEILGLKRCCHMFELVEFYDRVPYWVQAGRGEKVDWDKAFKGFDSTVDWPAAPFFRQLADYYPEAKVVLTVRDPDEWFASAASTIAPIMIEMSLQKSLPHGEMMSQIMNVFGGNFNSSVHCISVYKKHNEEVKRTIPPDRLLVMEVAEGWKPLCEFLRLPIPDAPFPKINNRHEFREIANDHLERLRSRLQSGDINTTNG